MLFQWVCLQPRNRPVSFHYRRVEKIDGLSLAILAQPIRHPRKLRRIPIRLISAERHGVAEKPQYLFLRHARAIEPAVQRLATTIHRECERSFFSEMQQQR